MIKRSLLRLGRFFLLSLALGLAFPATTMAAALPQAPVTAALPDSRLTPELSPTDQMRYRAIFAAQQKADWARADLLIAGLDNQILLGHVQFQRYFHPTSWRASYEELASWLTHYGDDPAFAVGGQANQVYQLAQKRRREAKNSNITLHKPNPYRGLDSHLLATLQPWAELGVIDLTQGDFAAIPLSTSDSSQNNDDDVDIISLNGDKASPATAEEEPALPRRLPGNAGNSSKDNDALQKKIRRLVSRGSVTQALDFLETYQQAIAIKPQAAAQALGIISRGYYRYHLDDKALAVAAKAVAKAGDQATAALWWGGLAAWRKKDLPLAGRYFASLAQSSKDNWQRAAAAFWASRAFLANRQPQQVSKMLAIAAQYPRSFYGQLAIRALGLPSPFSWAGQPQSQQFQHLIATDPLFRQIRALAEIGESKRASALVGPWVQWAIDLAMPHAKKNKKAVQAPALAPAAIKSILAQTQGIITLFEAAGLADTALRLGQQLERLTGYAFDQGLYPTPLWQPAAGFDIDRAIIYAFTRQESQFRADAGSPAGAQGLMQLLPSTAAFISGTPFHKENRHLLLDPAINITLGQDYLLYLLKIPDIAGNLFYAAAAYNGGPGNLAKWRQKIDYGDDPLLFIESMPSRETRLYIERVMANLWIYRDRLNQGKPSLDALLAGHWPLYLNLDRSPITGHSLSSLSKAR